MCPVLAAVLVSLFTFVVWLGIQWRAFLGIQVRFCRPLAALPILVLSSDACLRTALHVSESNGVECFRFSQLRLFHHWTPPLASTFARAFFVAQLAQSLCISHSGDIACPGRWRCGLSQGWAALRLSECVGGSCLRVERRHFVQN